MYHINGKFGQVRLCRSCVKRRNVQVPFDYAGAGWHRCNDLYRIRRPHGIDVYTVFFSLTAGGCFRLRNKTYEIPASSIAILPPDVAHEYYAARGAWWEFYWIHIGKRNAEILEKIIQRHGYVYITKNAAVIGKKIERLFPEHTLPDDILFEITASQVISNIFHMMLEDSYTVVTDHQKSVGLVAEIIREMEENYSVDINIADLANKNYVSQQHLIRIFKSETGYTPYEYLKKYRLKKATELLTYTDYSVAEIAESIGFPSNSNFIFQFKNEYEITPAKYRKYLCAGD